LVSLLLFDAANSLVDLVVDDCVLRAEIRNLRHNRRKIELFAKEKELVHISPVGSDRLPPTAVRMF
jgi:hypothetical protein